MQPVMPKAIPSPTQLLQAVQHKEFDVIAFETVPSLKEGQAIAHLLRTELVGQPAWLTFNCKDMESLSHGESFAKDAVPLAVEVMVDSPPSFHYSIGKSLILALFWKPGSK